MFEKFDWNAVRENYIAFWRHELHRPLVKLITDHRQTLNAIKTYGKRDIMYLMMEPLSPHQADEFFNEIKNQ